MKEIENIWPFQELFVDPELALKTEKVKATVNLKTAVSIKKTENLTAVIVEIFGSITEGKCQIANIRFVNVTMVENPIKNREKLREKFLKKRVKELLSFLPDYLSRAGISIEKYIENGNLTVPDRN